ncbi:MAG: M6 family metalloprotease domain-containing protein, partial [Candidatus Eisenbacteria bacterium]|nr:M6 family metalloprotease domain-containing protein [Candidatus Eisenbacteria bacterium]
FDDNEANQDDYPPQHYDDMLFSEGIYPTGSMRDWYLENSYGEFGVDGVVTVWYRMPEPYSYYVDGQAGFGNYPHNAQKLAEDAVAAADPDIDFSQFDNDGPDGIPDSGDDDGYVDALFVVHAGPGRETTGSDDDIHSHAWVMSSPQAVDGVEAYGYSMEPEDGKRGVFGHEFGHVLGLPDLYDTDYSSDGIGFWGMMSSGSWGGSGETPTHFTAWCKMRLGFLDPITPDGNLSGVLVARAEDNPVAYKLWTNGLAEREYFLVENRRQVLSDVSLPGEGLLIYHVDENVSGNQNDWHPLVMVEQADGLFELQSGDGSDDGDPYPGAADNYELSGATNPSSNDYDGAGTQVAVYLQTGSQDIMEIDLVVETEPNLILEAYSVDDSEGGNGDGRLDPGEAVELPTLVQNVGVGVTGVSGTLTEPGGQGVTITQASSDYGDLPADGANWGTPPYAFELDGAATIEAVRLDVDFSGDGGYAKSVSLLLGVADSLGFFGWDHAVVTPGYVDQWHLSTEKNHTPGGTYCWKFGDTEGGNYTNNADGALETDPISTGENTMLSFWHWIEAEDDQGNTAWDGGILEVSVDGGAWTQITPEGGYPYTIIDNPASPFPGGTPCFSGHSTEWEQVEVDLSGLGSPVQLRWRFGSDGYVTDGGWFIDDVALTGATSGAPDLTGRPGGVWMARPWPNPFQGSTTLAFTVSQPGARYRLDLFDLSGRLVRSLARGVAPAAGVRQTVVWDGRTAAGQPSPAGLYFARLEIDGAEVAARKIIHIR